LLRTRYPAEAVIPPRIKSLPAVLKNSFRFIILISFLYCGAWLAVFSNYCCGCTFSNIFICHPPVETGGYSYLTPSEFYFKLQFVFFNTHYSYLNVLLKSQNYFGSKTRIIFLSKSRA
jgi:hypothetical protein